MFVPLFWSSHHFVMVAVMFLDILFSLAWSVRHISSCGLISILFPVCLDLPDLYRIFFVLFCFRRCSLSWICFAWSGLIWPLASVFVVRVLDLVDILCSLIWSSHASVWGRSGLAAFPPVGLVHCLFLRWYIPLYLMWLCSRKSAKHPFSVRYPLARTESHYYSSVFWHDHYLV